jgi:hypothetical protein
MPILNAVDMLAARAAEKRSQARQDELLLNQQNREDSLRREDWQREDEWTKKQWEREDDWRKKSVLQQMAGNKDLTRTARQGYGRQFAGAMGLDAGGMEFEPDNSLIVDDAFLTKYPDMAKILAPIKGTKMTPEQYKEWVKYYADTSAEQRKMDIDQFRADTDREYSRGRLGLEREDLALKGLEFDQKGGVKVSEMLKDLDMQIQDRQGDIDALMKSEKYDKDVAAKGQVARLQREIERLRRQQGEIQYETYGIGADEYGPLQAGQDVFRRPLVNGGAAASEGEELKSIIMANRQRNNNVAGQDSARSEKGTVNIGDLFPQNKSQLKFGVPRYDDNPLDLLYNQKRHGAGGNY